MLCASCVTLGKFIHHSVCFLCHLKTGDVYDAGFPRYLRSSPVRMPVQQLAGCPAHIQCRSSVGGDGGAHPGAGGPLAISPLSPLQVCSSLCFQHSSFVLIGCSVK